MIRNNMISNDINNNENTLNNLLNELLDSTLDFIDSIQLNNEQRDKIIKLKDDIREETNLLIKQLNESQESIDFINDYHKNNQNSKIFQITTILNSCNSLKILVSND
jgi:HPt (histidine-containing phosphotransfer) domain-containing protein